MTISIHTRRETDTAERNRLFDIFIAPHLALVRRITDYLSFDSENADDNYQDALVALLGAVHAYDPTRGAIGPWITTVVRNAFYHLRLSRQRRALPIVSTPLDVLLELADRDDADDADDAAMDAAALDAAPAPTAAALSCDASQDTAALTVTLEAPAAPAAMDAAPAATTVPCDASQGTAAARSVLVPGLPPLVVSAPDYPTTYKGLASLTALQRRALLLTAEGWTIDDLTHELRLSSGAVRTLLCRARAKMRQHIATPRQNMATLSKP